jgi:hypothetical protein
VSAHSLSSRDELTCSRSVFKSRYHLGDSSWGAQFPQATVYAVISELGQYLRRS